MLLLGTVSCASGTSCRFGCADAETNALPEGVHVSLNEIFHGTRRVVAQSKFESEPYHELMTSSVGHTFQAAISENEHLEVQRKSKASGCR